MTTGDRPRPLKPRNFQYRMLWNIGLQLFISYKLDSFLLADRTGFVAKRIDREIPQSLAKPCRLTRS